MTAVCGNRREDRIPFKRIGLQLTRFEFNRSIRATILPLDKKPGNQDWVTGPLGRRGSGVGGRGPPGRRGSWAVAGLRAAWALGPSRAAGRWTAGLLLARPLPLTRCLCLYVADLKVRNLKTADFKGKKCNTCFTLHLFMVFNSSQ